MKDHKKTILFSLFLIISLSGFSQQSERALKLLENLQRFEVDYPQQKVFLHLDREEYLAGENIWYKVYLVNATDHNPDTLSTSVNVELFNVDGQAVALQLVRMQNGIGYGQITLPDSLPEGNYKIRSYTNWMLNFSEQLFFERDIFVHNPIEENFIRRADIRRNRNFNRDLELKGKEIQFGIFPEGGQLVGGLESRVAIFVADGLGTPFKANGKIVNNAGEPLADFEVDEFGMGLFLLTPQFGQTYFAELIVQGQSTKRFSLPEVLQQAYNLRVNVNEDDVMVLVRAGFDPAEFNLPSEIMVVAQSGGKAYFFEEGRLENRSFSNRISKRLLPTGVTQVTIFDGNGIPVAERLVFVNHHDHFQPELDVSTIRLGNESGFKVDFDLKFFAANDDWAHLSLAVEGADQEFKSPSPSIFSEFLLASDISLGFPGINLFYNDTFDNEKLIDLLLLTRGWRRFQWKDIISGNFPELKFNNPQGLVLSGQLSAVAVDRTVSNVLLEVSINQESRDVYSVRTNERGLFRIEGLDYNGNYRAEFTLPNESRPRGFRLRLDGSESSPRDFTLNAATRPHLVVNRGSNWQRVSNPSAFATNVRAVEIAQRSESIYGTPDQTIYMDEVPVNYTNLGEVFRGRATGVIFERGQLRIRGEGSVGSSNEPLFMMDGVVVNSDVLLNTRPDEVDRIEILKGPSTAIFGSRGANGVIVVYSKRGGTQSPVFQYNLMGFSTPREFFNSRIHLDYKRKHGVGHTVFWEPGVFPDETGRFSIAFPQREQWQFLRIILQGIHSSGKLIFVEQEIN
ncbi:MAG: TonB-dependent receptor plug domain-containing protein [Bacteroidales bacterium]|nr:TonB-dependent receptor plug domain-containing protein [Bacteroidales bacterium]